MAEEVESLALDLKSPLREGTQRKAARSASRAAAADAGLAALSRGFCLWIAARRS